MFLVLHGVEHIYSQSRTEYEESNLKVGFCVEFNLCQPKIVSNAIQGATPFEPTGDNGTGFGVLAELELSQKVSLVLRPVAVFSKFSAQIFEYNGQTYVERFDLIYVEMPLHLKVKPIEGKYQPFVAIGPNPAFLYKEGVLFFWDVALGCEIHIAKWTLVPELRYSVGTSNIKPPRDYGPATGREVIRANMLHGMMAVKF